MSQRHITWLSEDDPPEAFPPPHLALEEPNGLLAAGGDLSPERLLYAYRGGIFPWFESGQPILWWSPDPRCILYPDRYHVSRSLGRSARNAGFEVSFNRSCREVIEACSGRRNGQRGTWITDEMKAAYLRLHDMGWVHSVEAWQEDELVGGIYGLVSGKFFFGESMFSKSADASKISMLALCHILTAERFAFIDCQLPSPHLGSLGAELISRNAFLGRLAGDEGTGDPA
ncbi:MAG: leucyl/phenylalanyl-tRNA--protein transferase, partial [Woeseiaceae bacterium]